MTLGRALKRMDSEIWPRLMRMGRGNVSGVEHGFVICYNVFISLDRGLWMCFRIGTYCFINWQSKLR